MEEKNNAYKYGIPDQTISYNANESFRTGLEGYG